MTSNGRTSIDVLDLTAEQREFLRSMWIESVEEVVAVASASAADRTLLQETGFHALSTTSSSVLSTKAPDRLSSARSARPGGPLGCVLDERTIKEIQQRQEFRSKRRLKSASAESEFPDSVRLMDRLPDVQNQGNRGTCVAFASVALREFLVGATIDLSEQFLYWGCKELDDYPGPGTYVRTAMSALAEYGVCTEALWPYNPEPLGDDEGQGPPEQDARDEAIEYRLHSCRTVEPMRIASYKRVLVGDEQVEGMPVVIGTPVFDSWYMSSETHRTGKITLPLPGENPSGGHAWCIVGYVDNDAVPGGGYFIVRNSWGVAWASESVEAPGHALMPYEYVERFGFEAFTGPASQCEVPVDRKVSSSHENYVRILDRDEWEELDGQPHRGRKLRARTPVLYDRFRPEVFREATPENEAVFVERDCTWNDESRQRVWFSPIAELSDDLERQINFVRESRGQFTTSIDANAKELIGTPFPYARLPWWLHLVPFKWEPRIHTVQESDATPILLRHIKDGSRAPRDLEWPAEWNSLLESLCSLRIYRVRRGRREVHIVAAFVTKLCLSADSTCSFSSIDQSMIDAVQQVYQQWAGENDVRQADSMFMTIGAISASDESWTNGEGAHQWLWISSRESNGSWTVRPPRRYGDRLSIRSFVDHLRPETRVERLSKIKQCIDSLIPYEGGNVSVTRVKERTGYRTSVVVDAFMTLQKREIAGDRYIAYKLKSGELAIRQRQPYDTAKGVTVGVRRWSLRRQAIRLGGAAVCTSAIVANQLLGLAGLSGILLSGLILYGSSCVQAATNRWADARKD